MINLLPPAIREDITFARRNAKLLRACGLFVAIIGGIGLIFVAGMFYMQSSLKDLTAQSERSAAQLKEQNLEETQKHVETISSDLKLVVQVLSKEVLFSKLIKQIGSAMPANASLSDLKINNTQGGIDLSAIAVDYNAATQVQVNLQDPANKIFDKADILNITCGTATLDPKYPCTITIRARFGKNNQFLFISPGTKS